MGLADLHIHTIHSSDGTSSVPAVLKYVADKTDLDVIAITDHDNMDGVNEALELAPAYGLEIIPGSEVSTRDGHLLALFIHHPIPMGMSLVDTVLAAAEQGGICVAAHPMAMGVHSLKISVILDALQIPEVCDSLAGIETYNGGLVYTRNSAVCEAISRLLPLAQMGNSDAHILKTIGDGATEFPGKTAADLRKAIFERTTVVKKGRGLDGFRVVRNYIPCYLLRKAGWVIDNTHPDEPLRYTRLQKALHSPAALPAH